MNPAELAWLPHVSNLTPTERAVTRKFFLDDEQNVARGTLWKRLSNLLKAIPRSSETEEFDLVRTTRALFFLRQLAKEILVVTEQPRLARADAERYTADLHQATNVFLKVLRLGRKAGHAADAARAPFEVTLAELLQPLADAGKYTPNAHIVSPRLNAVRASDLVKALQAILSDRVCNAAEPRPTVLTNARARQIARVTFECTQAHFARMDTSLVQAVVQIIEPAVYLDSTQLARVKARVPSR